MKEVTTPLPNGAAIYEHNIVVGLPGKGNAGNVYLVQDQHDKQGLFAFAEISNPGEQKRYRFVLEYVSPAPLDRQALPLVQYAFNDDTSRRAYVLMRYLEEQNLEMLRLQQTVKRFPLPQVMTYMAPVIDAVTHLHSRQPPVIHGNIHPTSIIVTQGDAVMLVMLHLVEEDGLVTTTLPCFVPGYGAAEQYAGEGDVRADVYGLGATCYTLVTGLIPPDAKYRSIQLSKGEVDPLKPVNELVSSIPTLMAGAIQRAMAVNAHDRFASVKQFWEAFTTAGPLSTIPDSSPEPLLIQPASPSTSLLLPSTPVPETLPVFSSEEHDKPTPLPMPVGLKSAPAPAPTGPGVSPARKAGLALVVLILMIGLLSSVGFKFNLPTSHSARPTQTVTHLASAPVPFSTPVATGSPAHASTYAGTIYDVATNVSTSMSLTVIQQSNSSISGRLTLGPKLQGSGIFKGTINTSNVVQFVVADTNGKPFLFFEGTIRSTTSINGDFYLCNPANPANGGSCSRAGGEYGIWDVELTS